MVEKMVDIGLITLISKSSGIIWLTIVGAMVASNVSLSTPLTLNFGDVPFELQRAFDMIMPGFLPLMLSLLVIALLRKNVKANWIIIGMMVVAIAGRCIGIL